MMQRGDDTGDQPAYAFLARNPAQTFYNEMQTFSVKRYADLPHSNVRDVTENYGFVMRHAAILNKNGPWMDGFYCQHKTDVEWQRFGKDSRTGIVLPVIASSLTLGRVLQSLRARFQASLTVLDALGLSVFLIDGTGCVIEHNKEARRVLDKADGLSLTKDNRLKLHSPDKTSALESMINAANGLLHGEIEKTHSLMAASRPSGAYDYLISVRSLSDSRAELETGFKCAFVTVIDPSRDKALSAEGIIALGQLTEAESNVVNLLVQGFRPSDVAERREVSLSTVKTQLKIISQKLRCSTQSDIIRIAAATRISIEKN